MRGFYGRFRGHWRGWRALDFVSRLIFVALVALFVSHAKAVGTAPTDTQTTYSTNCSDGTTYSSGSANGAATQCAAAMNAKQPGGNVSVNGKVCPATNNFTATDIKVVSGGFSYTLQQVQTYSGGPNCPAPIPPPLTLRPGLTGNITSVLGCGDGGTLNASKSQCNCNFGFAPNKSGTKCEQYTCPPSGGYSAVTQPDQKVANAGDGMCTGGCGYQPSSWKVGEDGQIWATWPFKSTGKFCGGDKSPTDPAVDTGEKNSKNPAPVACGQNQCPGSVNGATVCVPCNKNVEQGPQTSASAPGANGSTGTQTNTNSQTECNGISCTTTTTTRDGNGTITGQQQTTDKQENFCKQNPQSALCKTSLFNGSCSAVQCDGDAIQCAIAADQYRRNCQWFDDPGTDPLKQIGADAMNGQLQPADHPATTAVTQSVSFSSTIDQTDRLGSSCPQDVAVTVLGKAVSMPLSKACAPLQLVGQLAVAVCALMCIFIVFK